MYILGSDCRVYACNIRVLGPWVRGLGSKCTQTEKHSDRRILSVWGKDQYGIGWVAVEDRNLRYHTRDTYQLAEFPMYGDKFSSLPAAPSEKYSRSENPGLSGHASKG